MASSPRHFLVCAHEQFPPSDLLRQAIEGERAAFCWAGDDDAALECAPVWKGSQPQEVYRDDRHDPSAMQEEGERQISDAALRDAMIITSDPEIHVERIREVERMGATTVALMNNSGADPHAAIELYGRKVLPVLRGDAGRWMSAA